MERGGRFHRYRRHAKQPSISAGASSADQANSVLPSTLNPSHANGSNSATAEATQKQQQPGLYIVREQDQYMPIANVIRIMRRILPPHAKISDDAKETIQECVSEYISFITGEANDRCQREQRKTITAEDVLWAMGKLGFDEYVEPLSLFLSKYRESENERNSSVRDPILRRSGVTVADYGNFPMPPFVPGLHMGQHVPGMGMGMGFFDPSMYGGYYRNAFDGAGGGGSGSGSGGAGGSSGGGAGGSSYSSNPQINYDPFAQYK